jgi:hypothetical protein
MLAPGTRLTFSPDDLNKLGRELADTNDELESENRNYLENIEVWWEWYEAKPLTERRSEPWDNASNVVVPLIRTAADALIARYFNAIHSSSRVWSGSTRNQDFSDMVPDIVEFLNWAAQHEFDLFNATLDWVTEMVVIGESVLYLSWEENTRNVLVPGGKGKPRMEKVTVSRGPKVRHIPREQLLWSNSYPIHQAPLVARQVLQTYGDLVRAANAKILDADAVGKIKGITTSQSQLPSASVTETKEGIEDRTTVDGPEAYAQYDVRECWVDWPFLADRSISTPNEMEPGDESAQLVVTIHQPTGTVLRATAKPYFTPDWPFYCTYLRKRSGRASSAGMSRLVRDMQEASTTLVNQAIDAITLSNSIVGVTNDPDIQNQAFGPNRFLLAKDDDIRKTVSEFKTSKIVIPDIGMVNMMTSIAERISGISDPNLGRETRHGGHPSPATSTALLLQEGKQLESMPVRGIRRAMGRLGVDLATLYQQFEDDADKVSRAVGVDDAERIAEFIFPQDVPIFGNLELDLQSSSESMNPQSEMNKAILIDQATNNFYGRVFSLLQMLSNPQAAQVRGVQDAVQKAIEALSHSYSKILESADVDNFQDFVFQLKEQNVNGIGGFPGVIGNPGANGTVPPGAPVAGPESGAGNGAGQTGAPVGVRGSGF